MFILQTKYLSPELRRTEAAQFDFDRGLICFKPGDLHSAEIAHSHMHGVCIQLRKHSQPAVL